MIWFVIIFFVDTIISMIYDFDEAKNQTNIAKHGIALSNAKFFDWDNAVFYQDKRFDYGEDCVIAISFIENRLHILVFVDRNNTRRIISLRKANKREQKAYDIAKN